LSVTTRGQTVGFGAPISKVNEMAKPRKKENYRKAKKFKGSAVKKYKNDSGTILPPKDSSVMLACRVVRVVIDVLRLVDSPPSCLQQLLDWLAANLFLM
jgi:nitrogenase molybdenum-iron protein alpha/beta subunit